MNSPQDSVPSSVSKPEGIPSVEPAMPKPLRIWPAVVLVAALWSAKLIPGLFDANMTLFMVSAFAPALLGIVLVAWWCFFSRATVREKLIGVVGVAAIAATSYLTTHESVRGFGILISVIPWGVTAFAAALILLARWPSLSRISLTLMITLIVVGFWSTVRVDGIWGDFKSTRNWRWTPTVEQQYLESLATADRRERSGGGQ